MSQNVMSIKIIKCLSHGVFISIKFSSYAVRLFTRHKYVYLSVETIKCDPIQFFITYWLAIY